MPSAFAYEPIENPPFHIELEIEQNAHISHSKSSCKPMNLDTLWFEVFFTHFPFTKFFIHDHSQKSLFIYCFVDFVTNNPVTTNPTNIFNVNNITNLEITFDVVNFGMILIFFYYLCYQSHWCYYYYFCYCPH